MKKKISHLIGCTLLCSILAISILATTKISFATKENVPKGILNAFFTKYNGKALGSKVAFNPKDIFNKDIDTGVYDIVELAGNGKFYIPNYTIHCDGIGSFNCYVPFQLIDNAITAIPVNTYKFHEYTRKNKYIASENFRVYKKAGSKKVAYTIKKGNKVTFDKLYISESGKAYFRMKNANGKIGWIRFDQKGLFS